MLGSFWRDAILQSAQLEAGTGSAAAAPCPRMGRFPVDPAASGGLSGSLSAGWSGPNKSRDCLASCADSLVSQCAILPPCRVNMVHKGQPMAPCAQSINKLSELSCISTTMTGDRQSTTKLGALSQSNLHRHMSPHARL